MPRLYFKFGTMGSSKSAQALMCKFNYEQKGMNVLLLKPSIDNRDDKDGAIIVKSRVGLQSKAINFSSATNLGELFKQSNAKQKIDCVIIDEAQFCTRSQIDDCKEITLDVPVLCYGLKTNFKSELFEGSKRLLEIADSIQEIKSVCRCGAKSTINARMVNGNVTDVGVEVLIGGEESYENMCFWCWKKAIEKGKHAK